MNNQEYAQTHKHFKLLIGGLAAANLEPMIQVMRRSLFELKLRPGLTVDDWWPLHMDIEAAQAIIDCQAEIKKRYELVKASALQ